MTDKDRNFLAAFLFWAVALVLCLDFMISLPDMIERHQKYERSVNTP